ncbi:LysM peptidoglycan-binding domain-containing protein [Pseudarthrobacter sp. N5]|uniref:LysM peptidoglycan-binding domain-containing protein n=1 Tax=Pseudarthrobacter sp. N5 TaxID=3418416 RepID=UPI003CF578AB
MDQQDYTSPEKGGSLSFTSGAKSRPIANKFKAVLIAGTVLAAVAATAVITTVDHSVAAMTTQVSQSPSATATNPAPAVAAEVAAEPEASQPEVPVAAAPANNPPQPAPAGAPRAPAPAEGAVPASNSYTVAAGDTVASIAARFGLDTNAVLTANGLGAYTVIFPGQTLKLTGPAVEIQPAAPTSAVPAPAAAVPAAEAATPYVRTIYVAGAGGQALVDSCIGPIHFTPNDGYSLFITEHDFCGGWARFSGIGVGETVSIPGYGTYIVTGRGQVPNPGTTNNVAALFGGFPRAILQTCIPGTSQMLLIALN